MRRCIPLVLLVVLAAPWVAGAQVSAGLHQEKTPPELAAPIAATLAPGGVRATAGAATIDFWFTSGLAVKPAATTPSWEGMEEGTLVGAVRLSSPYPDIRGRIIKPGVYTLRFGLQPSNGDHLGVSPFREFLLLSPAAADTELAPRGHDGTIDLSKRSIGGSHPAVLSIDPPVTAEPVLGTHTTELGHHAVVVEVPVTRAGKPAGSLRFGIVLVGKVDA